VERSVDLAEARGELFVRINERDDDLQCAETEVHALLHRSEEGLVARCRSGVLGPALAGHLHRADKGRRRSIIARRGGEVEEGGRGGGGRRRGRKRRRRRRRQKRGRKRRRRKSEEKEEGGRRRGGRKKKG
jgi:hypothetical protein